MPGKGRLADFFVNRGVGFCEFRQGLSLEVRGHRVKVFSKSFEVYFKPSWSGFAESADASYGLALGELREVVGEFQRLLGVRLPGKLRFSVGRQHYALVRNELARDYLDRGVKLGLVGEDGKLWLLIDNSLQLEELETVHAERARPDNDKVKAWFEGVRCTGITPGFILESFDRLIADRGFYAENLKSHVEVVRELGVQVRRLGDKIDRL